MHGNCIGRNVIPRVAMVPPDFVRSVNPISTREGRCCPHITIGTPGFSELLTALNNLNAFLQAMNGFEALRGAYRNHLNSEEERMVNLLIKLHF